MLDSVTQAVHPRPQHHRAAVGVQREVGRAEGADDPRRPPHRRRDVVQLEVEHDLVALVEQRGERLGAGRGIQLEAHLGRAEPGVELARQPLGEDEVVHVQREHEPVTEFHGRCLSDR